jgi:hypothetical protein
MLYLTVAGGDVRSGSLCRACGRGNGEWKRAGWVDGGGVMLDDCRGEKKVDLSTGWLPEVVAFDAGGGVEGIWISGNNEFAILCGISAELPLR